MFVSVIELEWCAVRCHQTRATHRNRDDLCSLTASRADSDSIWEGVALVCAQSVQRAIAAHVHGAVGVIVVCSACGHSKTKRYDRFPFGFGHDFCSTGQ